MSVIGIQLQFTHGDFSSGTISCSRNVLAYSWFYNLSCFGILLFSMFKCIHFDKHVIVIITEL
jgi:hypothetical protein